MENQIKFTEEELKSVIDLRDRVRTNLENIGRLNIRKHFLEMEMKALDEALASNLLETEDLSSEENRINEEISKKYGDGTLDFESGVYTPLEKSGN